MRWFVSIGAVLVAGAITGGDVAGIAAPNPRSQLADTKDNVLSVDVELVIAVDVSYSMNAAGGKTHGFAETHFYLQ